MVRRDGRAVSTYEGGRQRLQQSGPPVPYSQCVEGGIVNEGERGPLIYISIKSSCPSKLEAPWVAQSVPESEMVLPSETMKASCRFRGSSQRPVQDPPRQVHCRASLSGLVQIMHRSNAAEMGRRCCLFWKHLTRQSKFPWFKSASHIHSNFWNDKYPTFRSRASVPHFHIYKATLIPCKIKMTSERWI